MATNKEKKEAIRKFILKNVPEHTSGITDFVCKKFSISRQAVNKHLRELLAEGYLAAEGKTRGRKYSLKPIVKIEFEIPVTPELAEDEVWRERISPELQGKNIPENVIDICYYGFTEMLNNVKDHSESKNVQITMRYDASKITLHISDFGVGIFNKIMREKGLEDERHVVLELSKGKLTTDPERHSGEGIFFTSRAFDVYFIESGEHGFGHIKDGDDWMLEDNPLIKGTAIHMKIDPNSKRELKDVFEKYYVNKDEFDFDSTHVPVALAKYGEEKLVSRSQAKRVLARFNKFKEVYLNFKGIDTIGRAFADEIFRVFQNEHPEITLKWVFANDEIKGIIESVIKEASSTQ